MEKVFSCIAAVLFAAWIYLRLTEERRIRIFRRLLNELPMPRTREDGDAWERVLSASYEFYTNPTSNNFEYAKRVVFECKNDIARMRAERARVVS